MYSLENRDVDILSGPAENKDISFNDGIVLRHHGCYLDDTKTRLPFEKDGYIGQVGTVLDCATKVARLGKTVFGMEASQECYYATSVKDAMVYGPTNHSFVNLHTQETDVCIRPMFCQRLDESRDRRKRGFQLVFVPA